MPTLKRITIQGFRCFGAQPQTLSFASNVAAVWGPNSNGKTSLCEAIEFLLTGCTIRREMLASAQDEFAGALRNAHVSETADVFVEAEFEAPTGRRTVRRT